MMLARTQPLCFFFFNDTATTEIYTLSLHDALPILRPVPRGWPAGPALQQRAGLCQRHVLRRVRKRGGRRQGVPAPLVCQRRSEEHTSELQSRQYLVCRLLLEKKKATTPALTLRQSH